MGESDREQFPICQAVRDVVADQVRHLSPGEADEADAIQRGERDHSLHVQIAAYVRAENIASINRQRAAEGKAPVGLTASAKPHEER